MKCQFYFVLNWLAESKSQNFVHKGVHADRGYKRLSIYYAPMLPRLLRLHANGIYHA